MLDKLRISPVRLARLLGASELEFSRAEGDVSIFDTVQGKVGLDVHALGDENLLREGFIFAELNLPSKYGNRRLKWLPKKVARSAERWLRVQFYLDIAPEIARIATEVRCIIQLGYLRDSRHYKVQALAGEACSNSKPCQR